MRKGEAAKAIHKAMGSLAFTAAARVVLMVTKRPENPSQRLVVTVKSNLAADRRGIGYTIDEGQVRWGDIEEMGEEDLGAPAPRPHQHFHDAVHQVVARLSAVPELPASEVEAMFKARGLNYRSFKLDLRQRHGIVTRKRGAIWYWSRPQPAEPTDTSQTT